MRKPLQKCSGGEVLSLSLLSGKLGYVPGDEVGYLDLPTILYGLSSTSMHKPRLSVAEQISQEKSDSASPLKSDHGDSVKLPRFYSTSLATL